MNIFGLMDQMKKTPMKVSAREYTEFLKMWVEKQLNNKTFSHQL